MTLSVFFSRLFRRNNRGQDLIEYALLAGLVAASAGVVLPNIFLSVSGVLSKVASTVTAPQQTTSDPQG